MISAVQRITLMCAITLVTISATGCNDSEETAAVNLTHAPETRLPQPAPEWTASVVDSACVARAGATELDSAIANRGEQYLQVSHLPPARFFDVIFVIPGYRYAEGSSVRVVLSGGQTFQLKTDGYKAYAETATSHALVAWLSRSRMVSITGLNDEGVTATDTYSLSSFPAAYAEIDKICEKPAIQTTARVLGPNSAGFKLASAVAALTAHVTTYEEVLKTCRPLVEEKAPTMVDTTWEQWLVNNETDLEALDQGRSELIAGAKASGTVTELAFEMGASIREAKQEARQAIESLPSQRQARKCYGILVELNEGRLDLARVAPDDVKMLNR